MKRLIKYSAFILGPIGVIFILLHALTIYEHEEMFKKNLTPGIKREGFWKLLPESSSDIQMDYDGSSGWKCVKFQYDKKDTDAIIAQVKEVKPNELDSMDFICGKTVKWWPKKFNEDFFKLKDEQSPLKLYKYKYEITFGGGSKDENTKTFYSFIVTTQVLRIFHVFFVVAKLALPFWAE